MERITIGQHLAMSENSVYSKPLSPIMPLMQDHTGADMCGDGEFTRVSEISAACHDVHRYLL